MITLAECARYLVLFTDEQVLAISSALSALIVAACGLGAAYAVRTVARWRR